MNLETLSSFALARMLNDCAEGSALQRAVQKELRDRCDQHKDKTTPWLFPKSEVGGRRSEVRGLRK